MVQNEKYDKFADFIRNAYQARDKGELDNALMYLDTAEKLAPNTFRKPAAWLKAIDRIRESVLVKKGS